MMIRIFLISTALALSFPAIAQDHNYQGSHTSEPDEHDMGHGMHTDIAAVTLSRTSEIDLALEAGGTPIVVEVLGVVCDFCAIAMNKTFKKRGEVMAAYVDLDTKTLNLVMKADQDLPDTEIDRLVIRSGYKTKTIHRGDTVL